VITQAPVVETARLRLRPFRHEDIATHARIMGDPEVVRHLGGTPLTREEAWRRMLCSPGLWTVLGYGYWAVERKAEGDYVGQVGFADFKRDMEPSIEGLPEMGWIFAPWAQGQGLAGEAVAAALEWADEVLDAPDIPAIISAENAPSIRLAEKAGFAERSEALYRGEPILLFRRIKAA
jgi:RimJ/RimL family protein N-acetyltransferase